MHILDITAWWMAAVLFSSTPLISASTLRRLSHSGLLSSSSDAAGQPHPPQPRSNSREYLVKATKQAAHKASPSGSPSTSPLLLPASMGSKSLNVDYAAMSPKTYHQLVPHMRDHVPAGKTAEDVFGKVFAFKEKQRKIKRREFGEQCTLERKGTSTLSKEVNVPNSPLRTPSPLLRRPSPLLRTPSPVQRMPSPVERPGSPAPLKKSSSVSLPGTPPVLKRGGKDERGSAVGSTFPGMVHLVRRGRSGQPTVKRPAQTTEDMDNLRGTQVDVDELKKFGASGRGSPLLQSPVLSSSPLAQSMDVSSSSPLTPRSSHGSQDLLGGSKQGSPALSMSIPSGPGLSSSSKPSSPGRSDSGMSSTPDSPVSSPKFDKEEVRKTLHRSNSQTSLTESPKIKALMGSAPVPPKPYEVIHPEMTSAGKVPAIQIGDWTIDVRQALGRGGYAKVYKATAPPLPGESGDRIGAAKLVSKLYIWPTTPKNDFATVFKVHGGGKDAISREVRLQRMASVGNPGVCAIPDFITTHPDYWVVISELADNGDMSDHIYNMIDNDTVFPDSKYVTASFAYQMIKAIFILHHRTRIIHRDIKPDNFLVDTSQPEWRVMLADFGFAFTFDDHAYMARNCATGAYAAPEFFEGKIETVQDWMKYDVFSLGATLYALYFAWFPPPGNYFPRDVHAPDYSHEVYSAPTLPTHNPVCLDMIKSMLDPDPAKRLASSDMMSHPCISYYRSVLGINQDKEVEDVLLQIAAEKRKIQSDALDALDALSQSSRAPDGPMSPGLDQHSGPPALRTSQGSSLTSFQRK